MNVTDLHNKKIVIVGLGATGLSCLKFLHNQGINPLVMDTRAKLNNLDSLQQQYPDTEILLGNLNSKKLLAADLILLSPGVPKETAEIASAIAHGVEVFCDVELFARLNNKPTVAITGSNGKSTVTMLVREMLTSSGVKAMAGGNIGVPVLELLDSDAEVFVLELSSFQLETMESLTPVAATILNVCEDHLDRYNGSIEVYAAAKQKIYHNAELCVVNTNDNRSVPLQANQSIKFGDQNCQAYVDDGWLVIESENLMSVADIKLMGQHNAENAMAATLLSLKAGASKAGIVSALSNYAGLPHRTQWVADKLGARWINDSKATNVGSTLAAINGLAQADSGLVLIAGGDGKGADFSPLAKPIADHVKQLITLGKDGKKIASLAADSIQVDSLESAVECAASLIEQGDIVLLSPACASLDMFDNFEQRGDIFRRAVEALPCQ